MAFDFREFFDASQIKNRSIRVNCIFERQEMGLGFNRYKKFGGG